MTKVAIVTGATRGIGKATALALAKRGYRVAVTGRTLQEGKGTVFNVYPGDSSAVSVPGSVGATVDAIRAIAGEAGGGEAMGVALDIMSQPSIDAMVEEVLSTWGRIDVLVNNAIYNGPGLMYGFTEFSLDQLQACLTGTVINQVYITRKVLPGMLARGEGAVFCLGSVAGLAPPAIPVTEGGWGFLHGASKSAFHRVAEFLHLEHAKDGIRSFLVEPQLTITESTVALFGDAAATIGGLAQGYPPQITGDVIAWLAAEDKKGQYAGKILSTPTFFEEHGIKP